MGEVVFLVRFLKLFRPERARGCCRSRRPLVQRSAAFIFLVVFAIGGCLSATAQQAANTADNAALPDAPGLPDVRGVPNSPEVDKSGIDELVASAPNQPQSSHPPSATIFGTVLDPNGAEVQGAQVELRTTAGAAERTTKSGNDGAFQFKGLPPGDFKIAVTGPGWGTYISPAISLHSGDFHIVSNIVLPVSTSAVVRVTANPDEIAQEQVQIAVQQRVFGVFPNFYSSFDWNAPPMHARQKYQLALRSLVDPMTFVGAGAVAGIEQHQNIFPGYGSGAEGYAKRFGAAYADDFVARMLGRAVFPALFHQDPRYFYKGNGSKRSRAIYAIDVAFIARGDGGHWMPNYSNILGSFAAGGISNLYYPAANRGVSLAVANGLIDIASQAGTNLVREFVLKRFTTRAQKNFGG